MVKYSKNNRILDIFVRLCEGKVISKSVEASKFNVDERSIQRDIDDIRNFLGDRNSNIGDNRKIVYDRLKKGFVMIGNENSMMTNSEILAVSKILLESRAFTKDELEEILNKLIECCVPIRSMKLVSELIANEKYHYVELDHKEYIQDKLWQIGCDIHDHNLVSLNYIRANEPEESVKRVIEPVAILFSEYYFYLNAYIVEKDNNGNYVHKYSYPAIFRIDRIANYKKLDEKFKVSYLNRFEEGEFRKRVQFMYAGKLEKIQMKFYSKNPEPILDRLPTARILEKGDNEYKIEAEVYGKGIIMWILSQGNKIEVIKPNSIREEMKRIISDMMNLYQ